MARSQNPLPAFMFRVTLLRRDGSQLDVAGFSECSGLESTMALEEYPEGGVNDRVHRFASRFTYTNIVLRRGVGLSEDLWLWHQSFLEGKGKRRDGLIVLQGEGQIPVKIWIFSRGLPVKWTGPAFNAQASELAIEALEIAHEKLELVSPGVAAGAAIEAVGSLF